MLYFAAKGWSANDTYFKEHTVALNEIKKALGVDNMDILPYSSAKNVGRAELLDVIGNSLLE